MNTRMLTQEIFVKELLVAMGTVMCHKCRKSRSTLPPLSLIPHQLRRVSVVCHIINSQFHCVKSDMTHRHRILLLLKVLSVKYLYLQISSILLARLIFCIQYILVGTKSEQGILNCAYNGYGNVFAP